MSKNQIAIQFLNNAVKIDERFAYAKNGLRLRVF